MSRQAASCVPCVGDFRHAGRLRVHWPGKQGSRKRSSCSLGAVVCLAPPPSPGRPFWVAQRD